MVEGTALEKRQARKGLEGSPGHSPGAPRMRGESLTEDADTVSKARIFRYTGRHDGKVAEWSKAPLSKSGRPERASRVRIPPFPPSFTFSEIERCCLGAKRLGMVFFRNFKGIFEIQNQSAVGNAEVRTNLLRKSRILSGFSC